MSDPAVSTGPIPRVAIIGGSGELGQGVTMRFARAGAAVPFAHHASTIASIHDALSPGQIVVDRVVPLAAAVGGKATRTVGVWQGSAAEQARDLLPNEVGVVSALHTVSGPMLANLHRSLDEDVLVCGIDVRHRIHAGIRITGLPDRRPRAAHPASPA